MSDTSQRLEPRDRQIWQTLVEERGSLPAILTISTPYDGAVFPPEIAAPTFRWLDPSPESTHWLVVLRFGAEKERAIAIAGEPQWTPDKLTWETVKTRSTAQPVEVAVFGIRPVPVKALVSEGWVQFSTSKDRVDASVFYRQVPLPFPTGVQAFRKMKWRLGNIASYDDPPVVMQNLSTCASCHLFSRDSRLISMEMNHKNDSGAHFIAPVETTIKLSKNDFMTWTDFPKPDLLPRTRGLFAKLSPGGGNHDRHGQRNFLFCPNQ